MRKILNLSATLLIVVSGFLIYSNRYELIDWFRLRNYQPSSEINELAERASLNDRSKKVFFARYPEVLDKQDFNGHCTLNETGMVLGCYDGFGIYILDVTEPKLEDVEVVTAAHEMLHVAYDRLSSDEKARINRLLTELYESSDNERIKEIIAQYDTEDENTLLNELHSILPTELYDIGDELEQYYSRYFRDRKSIVDLAKSYEKVFTDLERKAERLQNQIDELEAEITRQEEFINSQYQNIVALKAELDRERSSVNQSNYQGYNSKVNQYNQMVVQYNSDVAYINSLIDQYKRLIDEYNQVAVTRNSYITNINSKYETIE